MLTESVHLNDLNAIGVCWVLCSITSTVFVIIGFYLPYWIVGTIYFDGEQFSVNLGSFRRCNYPIFDQVEKQFRIQTSCGRYATFGDIPSIYWQISITSIGFGCILSILLTTYLLFTCCFRYIISRNSAMLVGLLQVFTGMNVSFGCLLYPMGWNSVEVRDTCGMRATSFSLGECSIGWSYVCVLASSALNLLCGTLSLCPLRIDAQNRACALKINRSCAYRGLAENRVASSPLRLIDEGVYANVVGRKDSALILDEPSTLYQDCCGKTYENEECEFFWPTRLSMRR